MLPPCQTCGATSRCDSFKRVTHFRSLLSSDSVRLDHPLRICVRVPERAVSPLASSEYRVFSSRFPLYLAVSCDFSSSLNYCESYRLLPASEASKKPPSANKLAEEKNHSASNGSITWKSKEPQCFSGVEFHRSLKGPSDPIASACSGKFLGVVSVVSEGKGVLR